MTAPAPLSSERRVLADAGVAWLRARVEAIEADAATIDAEVQPVTCYALRVRLKRPEGPLTFFRAETSGIETTPDELRAVLDAYDADRAELATYRKLHGAVHEEWTLGDDVEPYDHSRLMQEAAVRGFIADPWSTSFRYRRLATDWLRVDVEPGPAND